MSVSQEGIRRFVPRAPTDSRGTLLVGYLSLAVGFGGFAGWASLAPLASAVISSGVVKVGSSRKQIQHLEGGTVKDILVQDGDEVRAGDVLLRLDATRVGASLGALRAGYDVTLAQHARLLAERDGLDNISFPAELSERANDLKVAETLRAQQALFAARRDSFRGQLEILDQQIEHLGQERDGLVAQKRSRERRIRISREELAGLMQLYEKKLIDKSRMLTVERDLAELEGERGKLVSSIAAAQTAISEKKLEKFQVRKALHEQVVTELRQVQSELFDLAERLSAAEYVVEQTEIRAPVAGVVVGKGVHTVGGVIKPGEIVLEIVPAQDRLIVEARVPPEEIDRVEDGLPAGIRFTAFNYRTTPELNGSVAYVSADTLEDDRTGQFYFLAHVEVPDQELARLGELTLQPGMFADVYIRTGERTFLQYIVQPLADSLRKAWVEE